MLKSIVNRVFGSRHDRERRRVQPIVDAINEHYERLQGVSEEELRGQTARFRELLHERTADRRPASRSSGREARRTTRRARADRHRARGARRPRGARAELRAEIAEVLDELLPEAFATVREAARRLCGTSAARDRRRAGVGHGHYDVQLVGGIQLLMGRSRRWRRARGKTLVATLPLYLTRSPGAARTW
jgi:preprotein translocase subunit SecA